MGIKGFSQVFAPLREVTYKDFAGKKIAIDARVEIYRAVTGISESMSLRDKDGNITNHINALLLGLILKLKSVNAEQYWVFDYTQQDSDEAFHNQLKELELARRRQVREKAKAAKEKQLEEKSKLARILENNKDDLFSSDDEDETVRQQLKSCEEKIDKYARAAFTLSNRYIEDVIFMLNTLDIPWISCPAGYEAEQICAMATKSRDIFGVLMDYVLTPDADALLFGAT